MSDIQSTEPETPIEQGKPTAGQHKGAPPKGHPRYGGRTKTKVTARAMAQAMGADPVEFMLRVISSDSLRVAVIDPETGLPKRHANGRLVYTWIVVPLDLKLDAAKAVARYIHPTLSATQVTGEDGGPVQVADITPLIMSAERARMLQELALEMGGAEEPTALPDQRALPAPQDQVALDYPRRVLG